MDNDTTGFQMTAAVQPGNSGGPVLDGAGTPLGVTVARMNDVAVLVVTASMPQSVNFGVEGDVAQVQDALMLNPTFGTRHGRPKPDDQPPIPPPL